MTATVTNGEATTVDTKVRRLNDVSAKRVIDPDVDVAGALGEGQLLADELLSIAGLGLVLTPAQRATLSREEVASITEAGIRFEAVLEAGFALQITRAPSLVDPRITYLLHEVGEETRHQRLFVRLLNQLDAKAKNPLSRRPLLWLMARGTNMIINLPALLYVLVLGGEEIPDLFQKLAGEHPDTDPFLRAVNRYHRQEEARHLSFARTVLPEVWADANIIERIAVKFVAPMVIKGMFETLIHPGVYETVGLPGWKTWKAANRSAQRVAIRHQAIRPIVAVLLDAGILRRGRVPSAWRDVAGVDRGGVATS
ncbi:MAG: diiron oxygenase [Acidimicrobiales bacterium]